MISRSLLKKTAVVLSVSMTLAMLASCGNTADDSSAPAPSSASPSQAASAHSTASVPISSAAASDASAASTVSSGAAAVGTTDWNLILVNPDHMLEEVLDDNLVELENIPLSKEKGRYFDKRAAPDLYKMFEAAKAEGINLYSRSTFRTFKLQKTYYDSHVNKYKKQGMTEEEAQKKTEEYTARPGASEHHTGLAIDITTSEWEKAGRGLSITFEETDAGKWLKENSYKYGFILRYTKEKETLTKVKYEPWHFRYVGVEHAEKIYKQGICLEEYLEQMA